MKGKSLALFLDSIYSKMEKGKPVALPVTNGLEKLIDFYGVHEKESYALDEHCFVQQSQSQNTPLYYFPQLTGKSINNKNWFYRKCKADFIIDMCLLLY